MRMWAEALPRIVCFVSITVLATIALAKDDTRQIVRVLDHEGQPVYAAAVTLHSLSGDFPPTRMLTDAYGAARFAGLATGDRYALQVTTLAGLVFGEGVSFAPNPEREIVVRPRGSAAPATEAWVSGTALSDDVAQVSLQSQPRLATSSAPVAPPRNFAATVSALFSTSELESPRHSGLSGRPSYEVFQPSFQISGGLAGGNATYRVALDDLKNERPIDVGTELISATTRASRSAATIAWQVSPKNRLALSYLGRSVERDARGVSSTVGFPSSQSIETDRDAFTLNWDAPMSTRAIVRSSVEWLERDGVSYPTVPGVNNDCIVDLMSIPKFLQRAHCRHVDRQRSSGTHFLDVDRDISRFTVQSQLSLADLRLGGLRHDAKLGFIVQNERRSLRLDVTPRIEAAALNFVYDPDTGHVPEQVELTSSLVALTADVPGAAQGNSWSFFAEDTIQLRSNLTLTLGATLERHDRTADAWSIINPEEEHRSFLSQIEAGASPEQAFAAGTFTAYEGVNTFNADLEAATGEPWSTGGAMILPDLTASSEWPRRRVRDDIDLNSTDASPYLSVSWDPTNDGKTQLAIAIRRQHDGVPLDALVFNQGPAVATVRFLGSPGRPNELLFGPESAAISTTTVDRQLQSSRVTEAMLTFEHDITPTARVRVRWVDRRYRNQLRSADINNLPGDFGRCLKDSPLTSPLSPSPGSGFDLTDPYTGDVYTDTDPGFGDGRLDDCGGTTGFAIPQYDAASLLNLRLEEPDGRLDLYKQNPAWGSITQIDSSGRSDYDAFVVEWIRAQADGWQLLASYTWSKHRGNYERIGAFDEMDSTLSDASIQYQSDDRRHGVSLEAGATLGKGYRLGGGLSWESGLPYSILTQLLMFDRLPPAYGFGDAAVPRNRLLYYGARNGARNDGQWRVDLQASRTLTLKRGSTVEVSVAVENLLDDTTYQIYNPDYGTGARINGVNSGRREFGRRLELGLTANW